MSSRLTEHSLFPVSSSSWHCTISHSLSTANTKAKAKMPDGAIVSKIDWMPLWEEVEKIEDDSEFTEGDFEIVSSDNVRFKVPSYHLFAAS